MNICPADAVMGIAHKPGDYLGFPGRSPTVRVTQAGEADFLWYCSIGDGDGVRRDLERLAALGRPFIAVTLGDVDYSQCLPQSQRGRYFSCALAEGPNCVPCYYHPKRQAMEAEGRPLLASFRGSLSTNPGRRLLAPQASEDIVVEVWEWWAEDGGRDREGARARYDQLLSQSRFTLCPSGCGQSSMRLPDAIMAHSIPVLIGDVTRPFGQPLDFAIRTPFEGLGEAVALLRNMTHDEYLRRLGAMNRFNEEYLLRDLRAGCEGTIGITEYIREAVGA